MRRSSTILIGGSILFQALGLHWHPPLVAASDGQGIDFNRDIRPILSENCFECHGPDAKAREADLRLDIQADAVLDRGGYQAIAPGKPDQSTLMGRITAESPDERMPPPETNRSLAPDEIELIGRWIREGAPYQQHWSFFPPRRPPLPAVRKESWVQSPIDRFVLNRLEHEGLEPAPLADRMALMRRLSLDLTGLAPTADEVDTFVNDQRADAYEALVERLLASPHYGERMAAHWLDLVRYADTVGYHGDQEVTIWPYRDYVINAWNADKPFDVFTRERIAGDLLPDHGIEQVIASGYNRLLQTTEEGGAQAKEYLSIYFADRVRNVSSVWLGITLGCAQCHDHKFDPITSKDFYSFGAFFADLEEQGVYGGYGNRPPKIELATPEQAREVARMDAEIAALRNELYREAPELAEAQARWEASLADATRAPAAEIPAEVKAALGVPIADRNEQQRTVVLRHFRSIAPEVQTTRENLAALEKQHAALKASIPSTLISKSVAPRTIRILPRGNWMDDSGSVVQPAVPASFGALETGGQLATRLDLANWLVSRENPLTARVLVNRLWYLFFGQGISQRLDDLGSQGDSPIHQELLDWLAMELMDGGWQVKHLVRGIVSSSTYRQSSRADRRLKERDPYNRLLARQARFRLDAEIVRDHALATSGLLVRTIGGRSARPYQPADYYAQLNFPRREYQPDTGPNQYRRGLYTHWQRTFLHPMLKAFDAPSREECTALRPRSNTPLAALTLLNDPTFVEAARVFAQRIMTEAQGDVAERIQWAYRQVTSQQPSPEVETTLSALYEDHLQQYQRDTAAAQNLLRVGLAPVSGSPDPAQLAAWTSVARVIYNLHESVTRY